MATASQPRIRFYPVMHLMTGPPGLARNGGIWKRLKQGLSEVSDPPRLMVQALHFASYKLSDGAWEDWSRPWNGGTRLGHEMEQTFGPNRDVFVDSGGFQLLHADKIDLSRWRLNVCREDILNLQLRYAPTRIASLDSPLPPTAQPLIARKSKALSIDNAEWLASKVGLGSADPIPYLVTHGRTPRELGTYLRKVSSRVPAKWWKEARFGIALGSQVPLASDPQRVRSNVTRLLSWMRGAVPADTPVHVFGIGDSIVGQLSRDGEIDRPLSYDNSTYVQSAFRLRIYDPSLAVYRDYEPNNLPNCGCKSCDRMEALGSAFIGDLMSAPAYSPRMNGRDRVNRSDILAFVALHNLSWWRHRVQFLAPRRLRSVLPDSNIADRAPPGPYSFPLRQFKRRSPNLLLLPCSKSRPYGSSLSQRRVLAHLEQRGLAEGEDFDRITISGLYGPVHWAHENHPAILSYDFPLSDIVSEEQRKLVQFRVASTLNVIGCRYDAIVGYFRAHAYAEAFGPVVKSFGGKVVGDPHEICAGFAS
jgi:7-cyano-7-deazaguanine tRNA-ribosyltransferase